MVTFQVDITLVGCMTQFNLSSLGQLSLDLGNGFWYQEPGYTGGYPASLYCPGGDDTDVLDLQYAYPNPGTYSVSAQVNWSSAVPLHTNTVTIKVSGTSSIAFATEAWFCGVAGVILGALLLLIVFRWRLPEPPSLPPGAT